MLSCLCVRIVGCLVTFSSRVDVPGGNGPLTTELTQSDLEGEQGNAEEYQTDDIGDQEGTCGTREIVGTVHGGCSHSHFITHCVILSFFPLPKLTVI